MPAKTVVCIKGVAQIHGRSDEMLTGFLTPNELIQFCSVPSFPPNMSHVQISSGLYTPPIANWQRPLDQTKISEIAQDIGSAEVDNASKDSLMANPVLVGRSDKLNQPDVSLGTSPHRINIGGTSEVVPGVFEVRFTSSDEHKPLWVLDGQHRIHGIGNSDLRVDEDGNPIPNNGTLLQNQPIPVVFIIEQNYTAKFLAKIFTQVTTKAEPMHAIHGDWMEYAFDMGDYDGVSAKYAMNAVADLTTIQEFDNVANPFFGQIVFNPKNTQIPEKMIDDQVSSKKFRIFLQKYYFDNLTNLHAEHHEDPVMCAEEHPGLTHEAWVEVQAGLTDETILEQIKTRRERYTRKFAKAFVRFYRAGKETDTTSNNGSKIFDTDNLLPKFSKQFFQAFLEYLATDYSLLDKTKQEWVEFLTGDERMFDQADWSLEDAGSTQSNLAYKPSEKAASVTFAKFFHSPEDFDGIDPVTYLFGPGMIEYQTANRAARWPRATYHPEEVVAAGGSPEIRLRDSGHKMLRFVSLDYSQATITSVEHDLSGEMEKLSQKTDKITFPDGNGVCNVQVTALCYSESSSRTTTYRVLY